MSADVYDCTSIPLECAEESLRGALPQIPTPGGNLFGGSAGHAFMTAKRRTADVVVVGGGCMGASIAWHLARRGTRVVLLEGTHLAAGATGHSGALVRRHYEHPVGLDLALESERFFERFRSHTRYDAGFVRVGFTAGARRADIPALRRLLRLQRAHGVRAELVSASELGHLERGMRIDDLAAGAYDRSAGYADPVATTLAFAAAAQDEGVEVREHDEVSRIVLRDDNAIGVHTRHGSIQADNVVVAAGNWTPRLLATAKVRLPIRFVRGAVAMFRRPPDFGPPPRLHFDFYNNTYSRPDGLRDTLVGYMSTDLRTAQIRPVPFNGTLPESTALDLRARLAARFPGFARAQVRGGWAGLYDVTPDHYPILGPCGPRGLVVAAGFSGHGFKLCPAVGRLIADALLHNRRDPLLAALAASRFARHRQIRPVAPFPARGDRLP